MKYSSSSPFHFKQLLLATTVLGTASFSYADDFIWNGSVSADWHTAGNWTPNTIPGGATTDRAVFDGTGSQNAVTFGAAVGGSSGIGGILVTEDQTSALSINNSAGASLNFRFAENTGIAIESGAGAFSMGTSGDVFQLVLQGVGSTHTFQNDSANMATLGDRIKILQGGSQTPTLVFTGNGNWQVDAAITGTEVRLAKSGSGNLTFTGALAANTVATTVTGSGNFTRTSTSTGTHTFGSLSGFTGTMTLEGGLNLFGKTNEGSAGAAFVTGSASTGEIVLSNHTRTVHFGSLSGSGNLRTQSADPTSATVTVSIGALNTNTEFSGGISQSTANRIIALTKVGTGSLTLSGTNSYAGGTNVNAGILQAGSNTAFGSGAVNVNNGGTLEVKGRSLNNAINLVSGGTVKVDSDNTGNGSVGTISATGGTFDSGSNASQNFNLNGNSTFDNLSGQGIFTGGMVSIVNSHNPGNSPGTQTFGSGLNYANEASLTLEIAADGVTSDFLNITGGGLNIGTNVALTLNLFGTEDYSTEFWDNNQSFTLISTNSKSGDFLTPTNNLGGAGEGSWTYGWDGNDYKANWTAVPEPTTALLGSIGVLFLLRRRRA